MISARMALVVTIFALLGGSGREARADGPGHHAVHYQGVWPPGGSASGTPPSPTLDRYAQPRANAPQTFAPPPGVVDRAQSAVTETGTAFRDAGQAFAEQTVDATAQGLRRAGETFIPSSSSPNASTTPATGGAPNRVSAPPWPASVASANSSATNPLPWTGVNPPAPRTTITSLPGGGWTSLSSETPPPQPATPPLRDASATNINATSVVAPNILAPNVGATTSVTGGGGTTGPQFPTLPPPTGFESLANPRTNTQPNVSPPAAALPAASNADVRSGLSIPDLGKSWTTNGTAGAPSIGRTAEPPTTSGQTGSERGQQPLPAELRSGAATVQPPTADRSAPIDPFNQPPQAWPGSAPRWPASNVNDPQSAARAATPPASTSPAPTVAERTPQPRTQAATTSEKAAGAAGGNPPGPQEPSAKWMPLVLVSLTLIGSLSANLFLGWSYVDARQKYRTLVRKTADKFRRATEAA